jgi:hypothetical protein
MLYRLLLLIAALTIVISCQTPPDPVPKEEPVVVVEPQPEPEPEPVPEPEPEPEPEIVEDPSVPIEVPEDVYNRAFDEVNAVIEQLNEIISDGDFDAWLDYLTDDYLAYYSHPDVLEEVASQPILQQNNIRVRTLQDYFQNVVRPSRAGRRLDSLVFYSDTLVEAVTVISGESVILYLLRKVDGDWKIDTFEEPPEA